jgi:hypothetical protein
LPTKVRLASTPILTVERGSPVVETCASQVGVFTLKRGKPGKIPARTVRMTNDNYANSFTRFQVKWLGRTEHTVLVQGFNGSHSHQISTFRIMSRAAGEPVLAKNSGAIPACPTHRR